MALKHGGASSFVTLLGSYGSYFEGKMEVHLPAS